ncbi:MAG: hypothetical protein WBI17_04440 [Clostridiaceae bacterium]
MQSKKSKPFRKDELLAYLEENRQQNKNNLQPFFLKLSPELEQRVLKLLKNKKEMEKLTLQLDEMIQGGEEIRLIAEDGFPGRYLAESVEEIIGEKGVSLLFKQRNLTGFPVYIGTEEDVQETSKLSPYKPFTLSILGLGDVGGTLLIGMRLLGKDILKEIKIFDLDALKRRRYYLECNEISDGTDMPPVTEAELDTVFKTDCIVFTVSLFIPPVGSDVKDVRLVQFEKNKRVLLDYARQAEASGFKGYYFIVSDPVDLLCMSLMKEGNIESHRIRGFGLGVMEARARFIAKELNEFREDLRTFGPHGKGLVVINSLEHYDKDISDDLTKRTENENFRIRETGFKPYIGPALSSGSISILKALDGKEHLSTWFNGHVFMGSRNTIERGYTKPDKISLIEIKPILEDTEQLLLTLYETRTK